MTRVVTVVGAGGVGKTTVAAAVASLFADEYKTLVITVDPARRLATALGIADLSGKAQQTGKNNLWAAALDMTASWEDVARTHAAEEVAERLIANPYFKAITKRFPASQAYAAADNMVSEARSGRWDVIVVDTPPASGGVEFFASPAAVTELVNGKVISVLGVGKHERRGLVGKAATPILKLAERVLGSDMLTQLAAFLGDLRTTSAGLSRRVAEIEAVFAESTLVIVSTFDPAPLAEAQAFATDLPGVAPEPELLVLNRVVPSDWAEAAEQVVGDGPLEKNLRLWGREAARQAALAESLGASLGIRVAEVPLQSESPTDLDTISQLLPGGFEL